MGGGGTGGRGGGGEKTNTPSLAQETKIEEINSFLEIK